MSKMEYELEVLKQFGQIDVDSAIEKLGGISEYFNKLTAFTENSKKFLTKYSPYKILTRAEAKQWFLQELKNLHIVFADLGMSDAELDLTYLERAVFNKDSDALEKELAEFSDNVQRISELIIAARTPPESKAPAAAAKKVILAVDDMPGLVSTIVSMLREKYTVIALTSATAAIRALEKQTPELFLLDIEMPMIDGYELASMIRNDKRFTDTPIIFLTAKNTRDDVINAIRHGGNDYIVKPVDKELLLNKIQRYLP